MTAAKAVASFVETSQSRQSISIAYLVNDTSVLCRHLAWWLFVQWLLLDFCSKTCIKQLFPWAGTSQQLEVSPKLIGYLLLEWANAITVTFTSVYSLKTWKMPGSFPYSLGRRLKERLNLSWILAGYFLWVLTQYLWYYSGILNSKRLETLAEELNTALAFPRCLHQNIPSGSPILRQEKIGMGWAINLRTQMWHY